jgi:signal transduction histidine kinase
VEDQQNIAKLQTGTSCLLKLAIRKKYAYYYSTTQQASLRVKLMRSAHLSEQTNFLESKQEILEDRLFKNGLYIGIAALIILLISDTLFYQDYFSAIIEAVALIFIIGNLLSVQKHKVSDRQRFFFCAVLAILMNLGWLTGGGISMMVSSINFLALAFILMIIDSRYYKIVFIVFFLDYLLLFIIEYFFKFNLLPEYASGKQGLLKQYTVTLLLYFFGGYMIYFLKINYNKERLGLRNANLLLKEKAKEISAQNIALSTSKQQLDQTIEKLKGRTLELEKVKGSLEEQVENRTSDLRTMNERLLSQNQQLEQYAYIVSHNLRAPVAQVKGLVHLLPLDLKMGMPATETLSRLDSSILSLDKVLGDLSLILQLEKNIEQKWQQVDIREEIENILRILDKSIQDKQIEVVLNMDCALSLKAIKVYVYSVLLNIIENAVKYADESKEKSFVRIGTELKPDFLVITISDNGIGIDMELAEHKIFQMYQRFNNTHPGQGFGLFLVKSQMEAMQGKVTLKSELGVGTTFKLEFARHL